MYQNTFDRKSHFINNPTFLIQIIRNIEGVIDRNITDNEETKIIKYVRNISPSFFNNTSVDQLLIILTDLVINEFRFNKSDDSLDIHELLKGNIGENLVFDSAQHESKNPSKTSIDINVSSVFGLDDIATVVKKVNEPTSSVSTTYFLLDSRYRILGNDGTTFFKWGHINSLVRSQGTYNSVGDIRDIISIKIMPFRIPLVNTAITPYNRISTFIHELCPQSYVAHEERRFHFIGKTKTDGNWVDVNPDDFGNGEFKFNNAITHLDSITIDFASPLEPVIFDKDRLQGVITSYANPTVINFPENHNLTTNDLVYLTNFTTTNPSRDVIIIDQMNTNTGLPATVTTPTEITIPIDTSDVVFVLTGTVAAPSLTLAGTVSVANNSNIITGTGTTFTADFSVGEYINIQDGDASIFEIESITNDTTLTIKTAYTKPNGTFSYKKTSTIITGTGTLFQSELSVGDRIVIADGGTNPKFTIKSITNNLKLIITTPYDGVDGFGFSASKNNDSNKTISVFFGSKRVFIPLEITYLSESKS